MGVVSAWELAALLALAGLAGACSGKERPFADTVVAPSEGTSSEVGSTSGAAGTSGSDAATAGAGAPAGSMQAAVTGGSARCNDDGNCECDESRESCSPIALCADGNSACDATCAGCLIEGQCIAPSAVNVANVCQVCDPGRNAAAWSNDDGSSCDDALFCTVNDACTGGQCAGTARECDDGVACNGASTCDEALDACTAPVNQCPEGSICDVASNACATTCVGCLVDGVCLAAGAERTGDPCFICDPVQSATGFSVAVGKSCGAGPTPCSLQDTCDAAGICQRNDVPANTACGSQTTGACDQPDACDGTGNCLTRTAQNETPCDDGSFCTVGDECQGGQCVPTGNRNCGTGLSCNEATDQCQCQGCVVGAQCFAAGTVNGSNPCDVCDPTQNTTAFSANTGADCGSGPTECSAQDTCNAQRQCIANDFPVGTPCSSTVGGQCQDDGRCSDTLGGRSPVQASEIETGGLGFAVVPREGESFSAAIDGGGDVNGDGIDDYVIGSVSAAPGGVANAGKAYVIFGRPSRAPPSLADVDAGDGGFVVVGTDATDRLGVDVAMAGDVNGDGLVDVLVSATGFSGTARVGAGYVIFGKRDTAPVSIRDVASGQGGFAIGGSAPGDELGFRVAGAGDVNADGLDDVIVTIRGARPRALVVFGKQDSTSVKIDELRGGFEILAGPAGDDLLFVGGAGDVNGDGFDDVMVGQPSASVGNLDEAGRAYIIFGRAGASSVDLVDIDAGLAGGFAINGARAEDNAGIGLAGAGDINGDGLADLIIGANRAASNGNEGSGKAYFVLGQASTSPVQLIGIEGGDGGFVMNGVGAEDGTGADVAKAGDINGDGIDDMLIAAPTASRNGVAFSGTVYVVFGKNDTSAIALNALLMGGRGGFAVDVQAFGVSSADVNGDGASDLLFGARNVDVMLGQP